jgi:hypothetical protein
MLSFHFFTLIVTTIIGATYYKICVKYGDGLTEEELNELSHQ